jgi:site-specific DNA-cytosine methylase
MYTLDTISAHGVAQQTINSDEQENDMTEPTIPKLVVRRLTPTECERLMGWPDDHTLYRSDGKTNSDSTRYKMCGNGVASPVAEWIGRYILEAQREMDEQ